MDGAGTTPHDSPLADLGARLRHHLDAGEQLVLGDGTLPTWAPDTADPPPPQLTIPANLIRQVLVDREQAKRADPHGLQIAGAIIEGELDLDAVDIPYPIELTHCRVTRTIDLTSARLRRLDLEGTHIHGSLQADVLRVDGDAYLNELTTTGTVHLPGARISGQLNLAGTSLNGFDKDGESLVADGLQVDGDAYLNELTTTGSVRLDGARITGQLNLHAAHVGTNQEADSLIADGLQVDGDAYLGEVTTTGTVKLHGARITGQLDLNGAHLNGSDKDGNSLHAGQLRVGGHVVLVDLVTAGAVRFHGAQITGQLNLDGAHLNGTDTNGESLIAEGLEAGAGVAGNDLTAAGAVQLHGAQLTGQLSLNGAHLNGSDKQGSSLHADRLHVDGYMSLVGLITAGAVRLQSARITGLFDLNGAHLNGSDKRGDSLHADRLFVEGEAQLNELTTAGAVRLQRARITGQLNLGGAQLNGSDDDEVSLGAEYLRAEDVIFDRHVNTAGDIDLFGAQIEGELHFPTFSPADAGNLVLGSAVVRSILVPTLAEAVPRLGDATGWQVRDMHGVIRDDRRAAARWLESQTTSQPWHELAAVYERNGQPSDARWFRYKAAVRSTRGASWGTRLARSTYRVTTGHGYYPAITLVWLAGIFAGAWILTSVQADAFTTPPTDTIRADLACRTDEDGVIQPPNDGSCTNPSSRAPRPIPGRISNAHCIDAWDTPCLNPPLYALGIALPIANAAGTPTGLQPWTPPGEGLTALAFFGLRVLAWGFAALLLAGVTGLLRKQN